MYLDMRTVRRPWTPVPETIYKQVVEADLRLHANLAQRSLTQEEASVLTDYLAVIVDKKAYGSLTGTLVGTYLAFKRKDSDAAWNPFKSLEHHAQKFGPLRGEGARWASLAARSTVKVATAGVYITFLSTAGSLLFGFYGAWASAIRQSKDPRLSALIAAERQNSKKVFPKQRQPDQMDGPRADETAAMARQRRRAQGAWQERSNEVWVGADDQSPNNAAFEDNPMDVYATGEQQEKAQIPRSSGDRQHSTTWEQLRQRANSQDKSISSTSSRRAPLQKTGEDPGSNDPFNFAWAENDDGQNKPKG